MEAFHILAHALEHAFFDTLKLIPFLFVTYLAMEALEHRAGKASEEAVRKAGHAGPAIGALLGVVPQCGFSAAASTLYAARMVTLGTLFAVFLSTSDEMLPILIAEQAPVALIVKVLAIKVVVGMVVGFAIDAALHVMRRDRERLRIHELCERDKCHCNGECVACENNPELAYDYRHDEEHEHDHAGVSIAKSALKHTAQVTLFIFLITLLLEVVMDSVGEEAIAAFMADNPALSVVAASLVGLIPNCAASVAITELYLDGTLGAGAMMGGLLVSAGVGLLVLLRTNRPMRDNIAVIAGMLVIGIAVGGVMTAFGVVL
ncbi:MAG: putative manganese transporter [Slackia sp.]|nr:putative manganese transporter [Slackia sp.]